jgi:hypothetical protein
MDMNHTAKPHFYKKHGADIKINESIKSAVEKESRDHKLPCALAFKIADRLNVAPREVGITLDLLDYRITKCQLGLFGYQPDKKKVMGGMSDIHPYLEKAIHSALVENRLPCQSAWQISIDCRVGKMTVSNACETLGIKIKPCQLGAF